MIEWTGASFSMCLGGWGLDPNGVAGFENASLQPHSQSW